MTPQTAPPRGYRSSRFVRRHRGPVALAGAAIVCLVVGTVTSLTLFFEARRSAAVAPDQTVRARTSVEFRASLLREADGDNAGGAAPPSG